MEEIFAFTHLQPPLSHCHIPDPFLGKHGTISHTWKVSHRLRVEKGLIHCHASENTEQPQ